MCSCSRQVPAVTVSPRTPLTIPQPLLDRRTDRDPAPALPFPQSCLIQFAAPQTASHSLTINKWTWPEAPGTICMINLLPWCARQPRAPASREGPASSPAVGTPRRGAKSQPARANSERKGRGSCTQRAVYSPAGHLTLGGGRAGTCLALIIPGLSLIYIYIYTLFFFFNQKHSNSWG